MAFINPSSYVEKHVLNTAKEWTSNSILIYSLAFFPVCSCILPELERNVQPTAVPFLFRVSHTSDHKNSCMNENMRIASL